MYAYAFESNEIDGDSLCDLSEEQLRDDLGVRTLGHRLKILAERDDFREQCRAKRSRAGRRGATSRQHPMDEDRDTRRAARRSHKSSVNKVMATSQRCLGLAGFQSGFVVGTIVATACTAAVTAMLGG